MQIGTFDKVANPKDAPFAGHITFIGFSDVVRFYAAKPSDKGPDFVLYATSSYDDERAEIGAAWQRTSRKGRPYLSVQLDSPIFPEPVNGVLIEQPGGKHALIWSRKKDGEADAG